MALVGSGAVIGLAGALAGAPAIRRFLFEVSPFDPLTLAVTVAVLLVAASAAA